MTRRIHCLFAGIAMLLCAPQAKTGWFDGCPSGATQIKKEDKQWCEKDGKKHGTWKWFHSNGKLKKEIEYKEGVVSGNSVTEYYANGAIRAVTPVKDGKMTGHAVFYYENGNKESEGSMSDGYREGYWNAWYPNGSFKARVPYVKPRAPASE